MWKYKLQISFYKTKLMDNDFSLWTLIMHSSSCFSSLIVDLSDIFTLHKLLNDLFTMQVIGDNIIYIVVYNVWQPKQISIHLIILCSLMSSVWVSDFNC